MKEYFKIILSTFALAAFGFYAMAQDLTVTRVKEKFGYADENGNVVIKADYTKAYPFENGRAKVQKGDKWGYIGTDGKPVIKIEYDNIEEFQNGIARVKKGKKYGYIREDGTIYISPEYDFIGAINEAGYTWVGKGKTLDAAVKGLYKDGKLIIPVKYLTLGFYVPTDSIDYTTGAVIEHLNGHPKNYEIDRNLAKLSVSKEPYIWAYSYGNFVFDLEGNMLVKNIGGAAGMPRDGYMLKRYHSTKGKNHYYDFNYIAADGKSSKLFKKDIRQLVDLENVYESCGAFNDGTAMCGTESSAYLIDKTGKQVSETYTRLIPVVGRRHFICTAGGGLQGIISAAGNVTVNPEYKRIISSSRDGSVFGACNQQMRCGFIGADGSQIIPFDYDDVTSFIGGKAFVRQGQYYGIIDTAGNYIVRNAWEALCPPARETDDFIWAKSPKSQKWNVLQISKDACPFEIEVDEATTFDEKGRALYRQGELVGAVGTDGTTVLPLNFSSFDVATRALRYIDEQGKPRMEEIDAYRFNIYNHPDIHKFRLHQKISSNLWDY